MNVRKIYIEKKQTSANTQYYNMSQEDKAYIFDNMAQALAEWIEVAHSDQAFRNDMFTPDRDYPQFKNVYNKREYNSIFRFMSGMVYNYYKHNKSNFQLFSLYC